MSRMGVAVINYNTRDLLRNCLTSVMADDPSRLVVADNGSSDGSVEMTRSEFPNATRLLDGSNPGFGAACNRAVEACDSPFVLVLNSDTLIQPGALKALTAYFQTHPRAGLVGPRLLRRNRTAQPTCHAFPTPMVSLLEHSWVGDVVRALPWVHGRTLRDWAHDRPRVVPWVDGAAIAIRTSAFREVGGFDSSFFMFFEDVDLCYRLRAVGWETHFAPVTDVIHVGAASTGQWRTLMYIQLYTAMMHYYRRHHPSSVFARAESVLTFAMWNKIAIRAVRWTMSRDAEERSLLRQEISDCRAVLAKPWRRRMSDQTSHGS